ncbi:MAG: HEPN domain-containing protein [Methanofollis sp.]|uniref:HEPN domain-containing protein n=1 Tax=Methanofollis sp. TaxID=2052835 RepID=UPI00263137A0|nr:HEPN domain-containing protein [Methanofollis sp.]MDD4255183.1 HEPN domain-containing protein [Methanofollis sp.]
MDSLHISTLSENQQKCEASGHITTPTPALRLLAMAADDLEASTELYAQAHYPQAIFLFQQAVEKATKSFGMHFAGMTEAEARSSRKVGHLSVRVFERSAEKIEKEMIVVKEAATTLPEMKQIIEITGFNITPLVDGIHGVVTNLNELSNNHKQYLDLSKEDLTDIFRYVQENEDQIARIHNMIQKNKLPKADDLLTLRKNAHATLEPICAAYPEQRANLEKGVEDFMNLFTQKKFWKEVIEPVCEFGGAMISLFCLSFVMQPHAIAARYPEEDFDPLEFYTSERPLIQALPSLYHIADRSIDRLRRLYVTIALEVPHNKLT